MHKILFAASEAHPLIKTGGLGDIAGSLPNALSELGQDVRLVLPAYREALVNVEGFKVITHLHCADTAVRILESQIPGNRVPVWLVDAPHYFDRPGGPYADPAGRDWPDNAARFTLFARAVTELSVGRAGLNWQPDLVHCNDWQTGLIPALLASETQRPATVFTIHNLAYQGLFSREIFDLLDL
ncbi:MAG: glycogen/starch synthase, partial [Gammaproteobacteria bacterium]